MTLRARLVLMGAALPALGLLAAFMVGGVVFRLALLARIDQGLLGQAAAESVSLFDGGRNAHLHVDRSPIELARQAAARSALYGPKGDRLHVSGEATDFPARWDAQRPLTPTLHTLPDGSARELQSGLPGIDGTYLLVMRAPLTTFQATMTAYWVITGLLAALVGVVLVGLQLLHAFRLEGRVRRLAEHMAQVRTGDLSARPQPDGVGDVISRLRDDVALTTAQLESVQAAQERLVADAAHELRTPLAAVRATVDTTLRRPREAAELVEALDTVRTEVDRLSALTTRLLDLARVQGGEADTALVDLRAVIDQATSAARPLAEAQEIALLVRGPREAPLHGDAGALRQAVDNLLSNAVRHGPVGSVVALELQATQAGWRLTVIDEGPGVPAADRQRIFEPFARGDRRAPGTGLGLSIVKAVAQQHHGQIRLGDGPGGRFELWLPAG